MPLTKGLFRRAIFENVVVKGAPLRKAAKLGADFAQAAGCPRDATPATAACRCRVSAAQVLKLSGAASTPAPYTSNMIVAALPLRPACATAAGPKHASRPNRERG